jgi:poly-gamma-glutamate capsule biosynthesis protein CapA/YwtB (metallophosphatase superfamily)
MGVRRRGPAIVSSLSVAVLTALVSCSSLDDAATPLPTRQTRPSTATPSHSPTGTTPEPATTEPLALAIDIHRPPLDLTTAQARRIADGSDVGWTELGQSGGRVAVRDGRVGVPVSPVDAQAISLVPASALTPTMQTATVDGVDPLRDPAHYPLTTDASAGSPPKVTTVTIAGDIMLGRRVGASGPPGGELRPMQRRLARADLTVGNLESTLSDNGNPQQAGDSFAADPSALGALDDAGFDLLSLANNHTGDFGPRALRETLRRLAESPIAHVGAGRDATEAWRPAVLESHGVRFGFVAFNAIGETPRATADRPGAAEVRMQPRTGPLDRRDLRRLTTTIRDLRQRVDVVIALPHWGQQYTNTPVPDQRRVGAAMLDAGADLVVGGHPHWVQGIQVHEGKLVVHSLGNLVFDMDFSRATEEGVLAELVFWGDELKGIRFTPYVIGGDFAPRLATGTRGRRTLQRMWSASDAPFRR